MQEVCSVVQEPLERMFGPSLPRTSFSLEIEGGPDQPATPRLDTSFGGLEFRLDPLGSVLLFDLEGVIVKFVAPYPGREKLIGTMQDVLSVISDSGYHPPAKRVSIALVSTIFLEGAYRIEDYIIPRFELAGDELSTFVSFRHEVVVSLQEFKPEVVARIVVATAEEGRRGIDTKIDVLDMSETSLVEVPGRLKTVKDLESHIFESTITDNTRRIYGEL